MLGANPLDKLYGMPVKDMLKDLTKGESYKNREAEKDELLKKCQEIYNPPGIVHVTETA